VSAIYDKVLAKDYEAVSTVQQVDATGTAATTDWAIPDRQAPDGVRRMTARSVERAQDLEHGRRLILWHLSGDPETIPGSTGPSASLDVFNEVQKGEAAVVVGAVSKSDTQGLGMLGSFLAGRKYFRGNIRKLGTETIRVLVDGVPTPLRTVHAGGKVTVADDEGDVEFWWLDDAAARLALKFTFQGSASQVVRIDRPKTDPFEKALAAPSCRSELPGIYFLTDSAELLPASQPTIAKLAAALETHGDWTLTIEGHTDSTGTDQHNADLSRRRAESLKADLVTRHGIAAVRLKTAGFGRMRPVDSNDTMDGRAHNRRVEIVRQC